MRSFLMLAASAVLGLPLLGGCTYEDHDHHGYRDRGPIYHDYRRGPRVRHDHHHHDHHRHYDRGHDFRHHDYHDYRDYARDDGRRGYRGRAYRG